MTTRLLRNLAFATLVSSSLLACGRADDSGLFEVSATSGASAAPASTEPGAIITLSPPSRLLVTIREVKIHFADLDQVEQTIGKGVKANDDPSSDSEAGWRTVFSGARRIDLVDSRARPAFLGALPVPQGQIGQLRLVLADDVVYETPQGKAAVRCPSCSRSGLEIPFHPSIDVGPGETLGATLELDRNNVLRSTPDGYVLSPVVHAEVTTLAG